MAVKKVTEVAEYIEKAGSVVAEALRATGASALRAGNPSLLQRFFGFVERHPKAIAGTIGGLGALGAAAGALGISGALEGKRQGDTASYRLNRGINSLYDRIRADEVASESFAKGIGSGAAETALGLTKDMLSKTLDTFKEQTMASPARNFIFKTLKREDPILADTDDKTLLEAYHTMSRIAPNLSQDKNAVRSFLTQAATSGNGLDFTTIKGIADAELAVARARNPVAGEKS